MSITQALLSAPARNFTISEEADICCHPNLGSAYYWLEDDYLETQTGSRLQAVDDNLYRITTPDERFAPVLSFSSFRQAIEFFYSQL